MAGTATETSQVIPLTHRIDRVVQLTGMCRSNVYNALRRGDLKAVKFGRTTMVLDDSVRSWISSLPRYNSSQKTA